MELNIMKPKDLISRNLKALLFGKSGLGKTYLVGSVANALFLDLEKGSASVKNKDIDIVPINDAGEFRKVLEYLKKDTKYETIIIDSLTRYGEMLFVALSKMYPDKKDSMKLWGDFDTVSRQRLEDILQLNKNIIITCLEEDIVDGGSLKKFPMYKANKFKMMLPSYFDFVGHLVVDNEGHRVLISEPTEDSIGKNRLEDFGIPNVIKDTDKLYDMQKIINKIKGE